MVGVLTITNDESYSLLYQSARYLDVSSYSHTEFDLRAGTIKVPSAFGVMQTFEVDLHIFPRGRTRNREDVTVKHSVILISALRACVRSHMLANCIHARPLMRVLDKYDEDYICWEILALTTTFDPSESKNNRSSTASESRTVCIAQHFQLQ